MRYCPKCREELQRRTIDGAERLGCSSSSCGYIFWENPTPVVAALVQIEDKFVLARNAQWPEGMFSVITGFLEKGESPDIAVARETNEELGVVAHKIEFLGHFSLAQFNQLIIAYLVKASGSLDPGQEISEFKLLSASELKEFNFGPLVLTSNIVDKALELASAHV
ncbi:NUDIX domain-containing protein [Iodobacter sp. LRB]|uniref:NUDIX domain-containing protein n=1 Tax=unclassified Iodobacter TaxID=235634 RepID=UPI000C0F3BBD|nr:NUDIX domain-containing protein [Iodobacter sp. BJB302]PHV02932.1 NUDIX hydrolase [Iodobacter sp. BJB302]